MIVIIYILCLASIISGETNTTFDNDEGARQGKFFSLFTIVKFPNNACLGTNNYNGTCLTASECATAGGTAAGSCAAGFGVCCTILITKCGQTATRNCTYFQHPGGVTASYTGAGQCMVTVKKLSDNICQLRLDFIAFTLSQPDPQDQKCVLDLFTASGASNTIPPICGDNAGQHLYLDMSAGQTSWSLGFITSGTNQTRSWNIKMSQIPCDSRLTAPDQCQQYFTEPTGTIQSFNFETTKVAVGVIGRQISNQDYQICIRRNQGFCGICYTVCSDGLNTAPISSSFTLSSLAGTAASTSLTEASCTNDWLQIPCASDKANSVTQSTGVPCVSKLCGVFLNSITAGTKNAAVYSYSPSFEMRFHSDSTEIGSAAAAVEEANMGFCLNYVQQSCAATSSG